MNQIERAREIANTYRKHGWQLARVLFRPETLALLEEKSEDKFVTPPNTFENLIPIQSSVDALWFWRASHAGREAWELRLVSDSPYALFETFEPDEAEEECEDVRREMEARLREYAGERS